MNKYTPGPWRVELHESGGYDCMTDAYTVYGEGNQVIAVLDFSDYGQANCGPVTPTIVTLAHANAHLIAIAPDMLDVLRAVAKHFADTDAPLGNAARALIAKVENDE